ncbi:MAG: LacI family transcriptional regulator [Rhodobacterales bacterium]|nr:MAG: LacI family transcriptional regulator [Rhodobacterales bacterium]
MRRKLRNMKEFSTATGLSRPTVSKYFNDPLSVRPSTRAKIEAALEKYDYRPNFFAVNQNRRNPKTLGIVVPEFTDPFYAELIAMVECAAMAEGYAAITLSSHGLPENEARAIEMIRSLNIGGVILSPLGRTSDAEAIARLRDEVPLLLLDSHIEGLDVASLSCDNRQGVTLMVDHLCKTGPTPCYIDMPEVNSTARERRAAYITAMDARGLEPMILPPPELGWRFERIGAEIARAALDAGGFPSPTVLCANDRLAIGALSQVGRAGVRIGRGGDCRIAGHDNHPAAEFTCPSLTTVAQDTEGLATRAIALILDMIARGCPCENTPHERRPSRLVLRESA